MRHCSRPLALSTLRRSAEHPLARRFSQGKLRSLVILLASLAAHWQPRPVPRALPQPESLAASKAGKSTLRRR